MHYIFWVLLLGAALAQGAEGEVADLRAAAEQGDAYAQLNLGAAYDHGIGVAPDAAEAERWYRRAAAQGIAEAQFNLGHLLVTGAGSPAEGVGWLLQAAVQGLADAQYLVGVAYAEGIGVVPDPTAARLWLVRAVEQGHPQARAYLRAGLP